jgi:NAD+ diphosphatase
MISRAGLEAKIHAFAGGRLDRRANLRQGTAQPLIVKLAGDRAVVSEAQDGRFTLPRFDEASATDLVLLGLSESGAPVAAQAIDEAAVPEGNRLIDLRSLAMQGLLAQEELALLAQARSLLFWHERHRFCANCGRATEAMDGGHRRDCAVCGAQHFPRTDPVVITAVIGSEGLLLGRGHHFQRGVYSALAGFMEPGESIEEAARREIHEETGIVVGEVRYHSSQPWPFPSSLMIGLLAHAKGGEIVIDAAELEDARWFGRAEILEMLEDRHREGLKLPRPAAIAHHLIRAAVEEIGLS